MKVFISWSGDLSQEVAASLRKYLPCMIQGLHVFMSKHDLESGARWSLELARELDAASFGIICLDHENLKSPWLLFEAGALTKHLEGRACCLLLNGLTPAAVIPPLSQFQNRTFNSEDMKALLRNINVKQAQPLESEQLDLVFQKWWPDLNNEYQAAIKSVKKNPVQSTHRDQRDILEEVLTKVRNIEMLSYRGKAASSSRGTVLSRPLGYDSLAWYTLWKFPDLPISTVWQERILDDIDMARYPTLQEVDEAVEKARRAVEAYNLEAPEMFKHGTDFITKSLGFVDPDFRTRHSFGFRTLEAFSKYGHLVSEGDRA